jgi:hypothetical protein
MSDPTDYDGIDNVVRTINTQSQELARLRLELAAVRAEGREGRQRLGSQLVDMRTDYVSSVAVMQYIHERVKEVGKLAERVAAVETRSKDARRTADNTASHVTTALTRAARLEGKDQAFKEQREWGLKNSKVRNALIIGVLTAIATAVVQLLRGE